jgi:hypothetical protein
VTPCGIPGTIADAIEVFRKYPAGTPQAIHREVLEDAREGKIAPAKVRGWTYVQQAIAGV